PPPAFHIISFHFAPKAFLFGFGIRSPSKCSSKSCLRSAFTLLSISSLTSPSTYNFSPSGRCFVVLQEIIYKQTVLNSAMPILLLFIRSPFLVFVANSCVFDGLNVCRIILIFGRIALDSIQFFFLLLFFYTFAICRIMCHHAITN